MKIILLFLLLAGCTLGPDYERPEFFSANEVDGILSSGKEKDKSLSDRRFTLEDFKDKTLDELLRLSEESNLSVAQAILQLKQARANVKIIEVSNYPTLGVDASYNRVQESRNRPSFLEEDYYQLGLDASWELDIFGGGRRRTEAALSSYRQSEENLKHVRISIRSELASLYFKLRLSEKLLSIYKELLKTQRQLFMLSQERYQAGLIDFSSYTQEKNNLSAQEQKLLPLEVQKKVYQNSIALLLGRLPESLNDILEARAKTFKFSSGSINFSTLYNISADTIRNRPDVRMVEESLIGQNAQVGIAISNLYPKISLSGLIGFQALNFPKLLSHESYIYSFKPMGTMPLFNWGSLRSQIEVQKLLKEEKVIAYKEIILKAVNEIKTSYLTIDKDIRTDDLNKDVLRKYQDIYNVMRTKYTQGLISLTEELQAYQNFLTAQEQEIKSENQIYQDILQFYKSVGG